MILQELISSRQNAEQEVPGEESNTDWLAQRLHCSGCTASLVRRVQCNSGASGGARDAPYHAQDDSDAAVEIPVPLILHALASYEAPILQSSPCRRMILGRYSNTPIPDRYSDFLCFKISDSVLSRCRYI
jgi:hypothetical protein